MSSTASAAEESTQYDNWKSKLVRWTESTEADYGNKHPFIFAKATDPSNPIDVRIATLTRSANAFALAVGKDNTIVPLHSFTNVGGTLTNPTNKVIALLGLSNKAIAVNVDETSAFATHVKSRAPLLRDIEACENIEAISNLADLSSDRGCANLSGLCLPPPYLAQEFLNLIYDLMVDVEEADIEDEEEPTGFKGVDPVKLLELALVKVKEFQAANETDVSYQALGLDSVSYLIRYLVSVSRGFVGETVLGVDENDEVLQAYEVSQHESSILPPIDDPNRLTRLENRFDAFQSQSIQLNHTLGTISDVLKTSNELTSKRIEISETKMDKEKDRTYKYHPSVINCLKTLASIDGIEQADAPSDTILRVLNCESHSKAELELVSQYKEKKLRVTFSIGTSKAIYDGKLLWSSHETPSCISPFNIGFAKANDTSMEDRHLMLSTLETHGKSMTPDEIKKSLKQALTVPESYHEVVDQGKVFCATLEILGGKDCAIAFTVNEFFQYLEDRRSKIESLMLKNKEVGAFLLFQIGLK
eukprot:scaffold37637_cov79-Cyclotella_meneghiniana.AAC.1